MEMATIVVEEESMTAPRSQAGFQALLDEHRKILYKVCNSYCRNVDDREDLAQEIIVQLWRSFETFDGRCQFSTWMYRITANAAYSSVKRRKRHRSESLDLVEDVIELHPEAQPEEAAETQALLAKLSGALEQLPPKLRVLVVLKDVYGLSHEEIGEELGISVAAAKVRLHRGRKKLRDLLYDDDRGMANAV